MHKALCDSFNTPAVMLELRECMSRVNSYLSEKQRTKSKVDVHVLEKCAKFVSKMMRVFGVIEEPETWGFTAQKNGNQQNVGLFKIYGCSIDELGGRGGYAVPPSFVCV